MKTQPRKTWKWKNPQKQEPETKTESKLESKEETQEERVGGIEIKVKEETTMKKIEQEDESPKQSLVGVKSKIEFEIYIKLNTMNEEEKWSSTKKLGKKAKEPTQGVHKRKVEVVLKRLRQRLKPRKRLQICVNLMGLKLHGTRVNVVHSNSPNRNAVPK